jgi:hypothetical protein
VTTEQSRDMAWILRTDGGHSLDYRSTGCRGFQT